MKNQAFHRQNSQGGNVMFVILVGIVLFAALSYAMSQNMRGNVGMVSDQRADLIATEMLEYGAAMRNAVQRLRTEGCSIMLGMSFHSTNFVDHTKYIITGLPADNRCHIFHSNGGGINWRRPPQEAQDVGGIEYSFNGNLAIRNIGTNWDAVTPAQLAFDLLMGTYVPREVCLKINVKNNIVNPADEPTSSAGAIEVPGSNGFVYGAFRQTVDPQYGGFVDNVGLGDPGFAPELNGKNFGCFFSTDTNKYTFYYVLAAR